MAKRFTDTEKWTKNKWFRKLPTEYKLLWLYIVDTCDSIGVWEEDLEFYSDIIIGQPVDKEEVMIYFEDRIIPIRDGKKWLIVDFIPFQYGSLSQESRVHQSYIQSIRQQGLQKYLGQYIVDKSTTVYAQRKRLSKTLKNEIIAECDYKCQYCGDGTNAGELLVDHIVSLSKGGTNDNDNLVAICSNCNSKKTDHDVFEFIAKQQLKPLNTLFKKLNTLSKNLYSLKEKEKDKEKEEDKEEDKESAPLEKTIVEEPIFTDEQKNKFAGFQEWITKNAPTVNRMEKPFTIEEYVKLKEKFSADQIAALVSKMGNYKPLVKNNSSAYLTFLNWAERDWSSTTATSQSTGPTWDQIVNQPQQPKR